MPPSRFSIRWFVLVAGLALAALLWWSFGDTLLPPARGPAALAPPPAGGPIAAPVAGAPGSGAAAAEPSAIRDPGVITQGVAGRTVGSDGEPLPGIVVAAVATPALSPFAAAARALRGFVPAASASVASAADGTFVLPLPPAAVETPLEVWALGTTTGDALRRVDALAAGEWRTLGDVALPKAYPVSGLVIDRATETPIAGAAVTVRRAGVAARALPGREHGHRAVTDGDGRFRFANLGVGVFHFAADAAGHARAELAQQHVFDDQPNEIVLALAAGGSVDGVVVDPKGEPIAGACVRGASLDAANPARPETLASAAGRFALAGLDEGAWRLHAAAEGHQAASVEPVSLGANVRIVLQPQGAARIRVIGSDGAVLQRYTLAARPPFDLSGAALRALPAVRVQPDDLHGGYFTLTGLDPGSWQLEVTAAAQAMTFSAPFEVRTSEATEVAVTMANGGELRGSVLDHRGAPLAGASVRTQPAGFFDGDVAAAFRPLQVWRTSEVTARTDRSGQFVLGHLAAGYYQLRIDSDGLAPRFVQGVHVDEGGSATLAPIDLARGTELSGTVLLDGKPAADVFVAAIALEGHRTPVGYGFEVRADAAGAFRVPVRLPPGRYAVMAGRRRPDDKFQEDADREASRIEVTLAPAEATRAVELRLPR